MTSTGQTYCKNCGTLVSGNFCQECGQRTSVHKVTFKETINDFVESVFTINAPFFLTLKFLITRPGRLFDEFLSGKRKRYYRPIAFFVLTTIIYLLIRALINFDPFKGTSVIAANNQDVDRTLTLARNFMLLNIDKFLFVFVFALAVFLKLFFYKKYALAEFMAISFYLVGMYTLFTILNMFYLQYIDSQFQTLSLLIMLVYFIYSMLSFFKVGRIRVFFKSLMVYFFSLILYIVLAFGFSYIIVSLKNPS